MNYILSAIVCVFSLYTFNSNAQSNNNIEGFIQQLPPEYGDLKEGLKTVENYKKELHALSLELRNKEAAYRQAEKDHESAFNTHSMSRNFLWSEKYQKTRYKEFVKCKYNDCASEKRLPGSVEFAKCEVKVFDKCRKFAYTINQASHTKERKAYYPQEIKYLDAKDALEDAKAKLGAAEMDLANAKTAHTNMIVRLRDVFQQLQFPPYLQDAVNRAEENAQQVKENHHQKINKLVSSMNATLPEFQSSSQKIEKSLIELQEKKAAYDQSRELYDLAKAEVDNLQKLQALTAKEHLQEAKNKENEAKAALQASKKSYEDVNTRTKKEFEDFKPVMSKLMGETAEGVYLMVKVVKEGVLIPSPDGGDGSGISVLKAH